jgi:predicted kinase
MAGLPGTGKSTLAHALASELGGLVLDKDIIRAALFPPPLVEYSPQQDDFCMSVLFQTARYLTTEKKTAWVFVDGRPFARTAQVERLSSEAAAMGCDLKIIVCECSEASARERLSRPHIAANRDFALYQKLKKEFEPIKLPHLVADTDRPFPGIMSLSLAYLQTL